MVTVRFLNGMSLSWTAATTWSHSGDFLLILTKLPVIPANVIASVHSPGGCVVECEPANAIALPQTVHWGPQSGWVPLGES